MTEKAQSLLQYQALVMLTHENPGLVRTLQKTIPGASSVEFPNTPGFLWYIIEGQAMALCTNPEGKGISVGHFSNPPELLMLVE